MVWMSPSLLRRRVRIRGRNLLLPRLVPRGIRGRGTGRIRTGRGILVGRLLPPGRILASTMMVRTVVVVRLGLVMVVLSGVGRCMRVTG
ncbi:hypothetical protein B6N38_07210 [Cutibacterium avidum]|nr:hypothetical protein B6N38_07210 [Cutibacterium avidum]PGX70581.1 hypothetical protein B6N39_00160 [Cutibacterium avidum]TLP95809.1 hypothetical protein EZV78_02835 [Cutibacterium avidum]